MPVQNDIAASGRNDLNKNDIKKLKQFITSSIEQIEGASLKGNNFFARLFSGIFSKSCGGIIIKKAKKGGLNISVYIFMIFGYNMQEVSLKIQEIVKRNFSEQQEHMLIKTVAIHILGFERGR